MSQNVLYNNEFTGTSAYYWWMGQIVDEKYWGGNNNPTIHKRDDQPGWGYRYKVRIFGRDTQAKDSLNDDELEWAEVLLPVTAGSGHAGSGATPNLQQGMYVVGFYKDGIDASEPIITGVLPNNSQTRLFGGDPAENYVPRTGYKGVEKSVSTKNIYAEGDQNETTDPHAFCVAHADQQKDGSRCHFVPKTKKCDGPAGELKGIQRFIKNALALINRIKAEANSFLGAASDLTNQISSIVNEVAGQIAGLMKTLMDKVRTYVINKLNNGVKDLLDLLPPNKRAAASDANEKGKDIIGCVFNKIMKGLKSLIQSLLNNIINNFINAPMCAIENFVGSLLSSVLGPITGAIDSALSAISGVLNGVSGIAGGVLSALNAVTGVLNFLSCDEPSDCTMGDQWSFWGGTKCVGDSVRSGIGSFFGGLIGGINGITTNTISCNTGPLPCGPPIVSITGGGGSGVLANPIVSATGSILGIDFMNGGTGYISPPNINIIDNCGKGGGAVIVPIMTPYTTGGGTGGTGIGDGTGGGTGTASSITGAIVLDSGTGYLPAPDGSFGGNGTTFAPVGSTIVQRTDGSYDPPYNSGQIINVYPGDSVQSCGAAPQAITTAQTITAPVCNNITLPNNSPYPVVLGIGSAIITNPGIGYSSTDTITITPDNGAVITPTYDSQGRLTNVSVINSGIGFSDFPEININSTTGINAQITPIFNIIRVGDLSQSQDTIPQGTAVIHVIDCTTNF